MYWKQLEIISFTHFLNTPKIWNFITKFSNKWIFSSKRNIFLIFQRYFVKKEVGIDWSLLSFPSYTYTHCFSLIGEKILCKMKKEKIRYFFFSNCSRCMVQPFVLEVLISSFERYSSWKITILRGYLPPGGKGEWGPLLKQKFILIEYFYFKVKFYFSQRSVSIRSH